MEIWKWFQLQFKYSNVRKCISCSLISTSDKNLYSSRISIVVKIQYQCYISTVLFKFLVLNIFKSVSWQTKAGICHGMPGQLQNYFPLYMTVYTKVVQDACIKGLGGVNCARVEYNINKICTLCELHSREKEICRKIYHCGWLGRQY